MRSSADRREDSLGPYPCANRAYRRRVVGARALTKKTPRFKIWSSCSN